MKKISKIAAKIMALTLTLCLLIGAFPVFGASAAENYALTFSCNIENAIVREINNRTTAGSGETVRIVVIPPDEEGWVIESVSITDTTNDKPVSFTQQGMFLGGIVYSFEMPKGNINVNAILAADTNNGYHLIHATYAHGTAKVQVNNKGGIGRSTILAKEGDTIRVFSQSPDEGYQLKEESYYETANGYRNNIRENDAFTMPGCDVYLNVIFTMVYDISIAVIGGTAFASYDMPFVSNADAVTQAAENEYFYIHMKNDDDHTTVNTLRVVTASGVQLKANKDGSYRMPAEPVSVSLTYYKDYYDLTYSAEHGTVSGITSAAPYLKINLSCEPDAGCLLQELYYIYTPYAGMDEVKTNIDPDGDLSFYMPEADVTVTAVFTQGRTVEWLNGDGGILDLKTYAEGNPEPTTDKIPAKDATWECSYEFAGWSAPAYYTGGLTVYRPIFTKIYTVNIAGGTAEPSQAAAGTLITLTPDEAPYGRRFAGWQADENDVEFNGNTFIMPEHHVSVGAVYENKKTPDVSLDSTDSNGYEGKPLMIGGTVTYNGEPIGNCDITVIVSTGSPDAEDATSYCLPVEDGIFGLEVHGLSADRYYIWAEFTDNDEYMDTLISASVTVYGVSMAYLEGVYSEPYAKRSYDYGEALDTENLYIWIYWMDGSYESVSVTADMVSGYDSAKTGWQTLTIACPYPTDDELTYDVYVSSPVLGDANGDRKVDIRDVTAIQRHLAEFDLLEGAGLLSADVDGDGYITVADATALQEYFAEFDTAYPIGSLIIT